MERTASPVVGISRGLRSTATEFRVRRAPRRTLVVLAFALACLGLPSTSALAGPTTTTTSPNVEIQGEVYARHLLAAQPIPAAARKVTALPTPIAASAENPNYTSHAWSLYLLPMSISVDQFVRDHLPEGETVTETGSGGGPNAFPVYNLGLSLTCVSPHITYCAVFYTTTEAPDGEQELRVDAEVTYLPIVHEEMPVGTVTVTGYGKTSLMDTSSESTSVVLTPHQAQTLRTVIAGLKDFGGGMCMEDSLLLTIKVVHDGRVVWSGIADECPGSLKITTPHSSTTLDNRSCAFWHVVDAFFAPGTASGTKADSKVCAANQYG